MAILPQIKITPLIKILGICWEGGLSDISSILPPIYIQSTPFRLKISESAQMGDFPISPVYNDSIIVRVNQKSFNHLTMCYRFVRRETVPYCRRFHHRRHSRDVHRALSFFVHPRIKEPNLRWSWGANEDVRLCVDYTIID